jgi:hypothetical protein
MDTKTQSVEPKLPPESDPNVQLVYEVLCNLPRAPLGQNWEIWSARHTVGALKLEAGKHEPFRVGNTYQTQDGDLVTLKGYGASEFIGTTYETMYDQYGHHRYTNRPGYESGRLTGTNSEFTEGGNIQPLYPRPPSYAVPALTVMVPEGWRLVKKTSFIDRVWPVGTRGYGNYHNDCMECGCQFQGDKRQRICYSCDQNQVPPLLPTAIRKTKGPELKIQHFNIITDAKDDNDKPCYSVGYGERLVYVKPKEYEEMSDKELKLQLSVIQTLLSQRAPDPWKGMVATFTSDHGATHSSLASENVTTEHGRKIIEQVQSNLENLERGLNYDPLSSEDGMPT